MATAFSSQSVMTLARADAGVPTATQAPIMAAETERLIVWTIDVIDFLLLKLMANCRATSEQMTLETAGDFGRRPFSSAGSSAGVPCTLAPACGKKGMSDYLECSACRWHTCCPLSPERKIRHFRRRQLRTRYITRRGGVRPKDEMGQVRYSLRLLEQIPLGLNRRDSQALVNERVCLP